MADVIFKNPFSGVTSTGNIMNEHKTGTHSTGPYLKGGIPYSEVWASPGEGTGTLVEFPSVTKKVTIVCTLGDIYVGGLASDTTAAGTRVTLTFGGALASLTLECRMKQIHIRDVGGNNSAAVVIAECTGLDPAECPAWSWATGTGTVGSTLNTANTEAENYQRIPEQ